MSQIFSPALSLLTRTKFFSLPKAYCGFLFRLSQINYRLLSAFNIYVAKHLKTNEEFFIFRTDKLTFTYFKQLTLFLSGAT